MPYHTQESNDAVILQPKSPPTAAVIWLHGLGADGYDFVPIVEELQLPSQMAVRFVFPHAPRRPVTINNGYVMRAWYDILSLDLTGREDAAGVRDSEIIVRRFIDAEIAAGIATNRIVVAGFSQGGAMALHAGLRYPEPLAGILALSTYLPLRDTFEREATAANRDTPILMCHGSHDQVVPELAGRLSYEHLKGLGYQVEWKSYPMAHQVCMEEIADVSAWLQRRLKSVGREL
ncbi:MAG: alpha/beta hydrolase-fold protein [Gammaproteobacteria bacterium]|nr:carboxylesterase [Gammaproteobacteria bacterium]